MTPDEILERAYHGMMHSLDKPQIKQPGIQAHVSTVCRNMRNRAGVRLVLACALAKIDTPSVDIRKPYTEIGDQDTFSGRAFDEKYIAPFVIKHELPCNPTTAFLTPALCNRNTTLTPDLNLSGRPKEVYAAVLYLLTAVHEGYITASQLLNETIRQLIILRDEKKQRMQSLIRSLKAAHGELALSAEHIITIIQQHLATKGASRLPVLVVAAAYTVAQPYLRERVLPLEAHNAADSQTHAIGDVQITLEAEDNIVTCYEMKMKRVTIGDIALAVQEKLARTTPVVDNDIFITTDVIEIEVAEYVQH